MKSKEIFSTVIAKAKDLANEMTLHNTRAKRPALSPAKTSASMAA